MMKKTLALLLCLCLSAGLLTSCGGSAIRQYEPEEGEASAEPEPTDAPAEETDGAEDAPEETPEETAPPEPTATPDPGLGSDAYAPDTPVASVNGQDVTWREYYYWLNYYVGYMDYLAMLGVFSYTDGWDGSDLSQELTNAQILRMSAWDNILQYRAAEALADQLQVELDEDAQQQLDSAFDQSADSMGDGDGECSDDEAAAFEDYLAEEFVDRALFDRINRDNLLLDAIYQELYGANGEKLSDEDVIAYGKEQGLMQAKHILLMTVDSASGEALSEEEIEEKTDRINQLYEELAAVQDDPDELEKLFDELMDENTEDGGISAYPDGYLFGEGVMVTPFEDAAKALEEYGLSEPVQSDYGWHIILRLPIDPDGTAMTSSGQSVALRASAASAALSERLAQEAESADVQWEDGFEQLDITEVFGER